MLNPSTVSFEDYQTYIIQYRQRRLQVLLTEDDLSIFYMLGDTLPSLSTFAITACKLTMEKLTMITQATLSHPIMEKFALRYAGCRESKRPQYFTSSHTVNPPISPPPLARLLNDVQLDAEQEGG